MTVVLPSSFTNSSDFCASARSGERPLEIAFLNLMPAKRANEALLTELLAEGDHPVRLTCLRVDAPEAIELTPNRQKDWAYALEQYHPISSVLDRRFDALIINGTPLGFKRFEDVTYWPELQRLFDWAVTNVPTSLYLCWGAVAALKHFHGFERRLETEKLFGVFPQTVLQPQDSLVAGLAREFVVPVGRFSTIDLPQLRHRALEVVAASPLTGVGLVRDKLNRQILCFNHPEYRADTLAREYQRDCEDGLVSKIPYNTFPQDDVTRPPQLIWQTARQILSQNWLGEVAAQRTAVEESYWQSEASGHFDPVCSV